MTIWLLILIAGLLTFGTRLSLILMLHKIKVPGWFMRSLRFVPMAVLSAIIFPQLTTRNSVLDISWHNPQLFAGAIAILIAWRTRNVLLTILAGMAALLIFQALLGLF
jgi:branched-subunit amino acid transport protein